MGWRLIRARRDAVPASVRRLLARSQPGRWRSKALIAGGVAVLVGLISWLVFGTTMLGVSQVQVSGVGYLSAAEVQSATKIQTGTPLARLDLDLISRRIAALAPVRNVTVERDWPSTLVVRVAERTPVAAVPAPRGFLLVDASGFPFQAEPRAPADLPLVVVAHPGSSDVATKAALRVVAALTPELRKSLVRLSVPAPARIRLELRGGRAVVWGDAQDCDRKARVATSLLSRPGKVIDVSAPNVVTVR